MFNVLKTHLHNYALHKTRTQLMQMTDWQLQDVGISRRLLNQGIGSWPWREDASAESTVQSGSSTRWNMASTDTHLPRSAQLKISGNDPLTGNDPLAMLDGQKVAVTL